MNHLTINKKIEYHCPKCFFIPLYEIDQEDFKEIKIKCPNNHLFEYKIFDFFFKIESISKFKNKL